MTTPLSDETLARMREEHKQVSTGLGDYAECRSCIEFIDWENQPSYYQWPCSTALLLAEIDRREAQHRWQGRNHESPVPHLATLADVRERVTGLREHDGVSCCEWATDGPCPWSKQGVQAALFGPVDESEFTAWTAEDLC